MDKWHTISISRTGQLGILRVDKHPYIVGFAPGAFTQLSLDLNLYIGGVPSFKETSPNAAITHNFAGCIQKVVKKVFFLLLTLSCEQTTSYPRFIETYLYIYIARSTGISGLLRCRPRMTVSCCSIVGKSLRR